MKKFLFSVVSFALFIVGCGTNDSPEKKAQKAADSVKKAINGKVSPVVKDVGT